MLIELYIFFLSDNTTKSPQFHIKLWQDTLVTETFASCGFVCTTDRYNRGWALDRSWMSVSWILESLHGGSGTRSQKGVAPPPPPLSFLVQLGKQSLGVVHYLAVTTTLSVFYHWAEVVSQCRRERFLPWLGFSSAKLQTSGLQLRGQSAYSVSQRPNWTQTWS